MAPKCYARHQHLVPSDATSELRRARAKVGSEPDGVKWLRLLEGKGTIDEVYKNLLLSLLTMDVKPDPCMVKIDRDDVVELRKRPMALNNRKKKYTVVDQHDDRGKAQIREANKALVSLDNDRLHQRNIKQYDRLKQFQSDHVARAQLVKIHRRQEDGKIKGMVKEGYEANKKIMVKKENEKIYHDRGSKKNSGPRDHCQDVGRVRIREKHVGRSQTESMIVVRRDNRFSSKKTSFGGCAVKKEPDHYVETRLPIKRIHSQIRNIKRAKCSFAYNSDEKYLEGEGSSKSVPEVIILDSDKVVKKEIVTPFVSSKRYHSSVCLLLTQLHPF